MNINRHYLDLQESYLFPRFPEGSGVYGKTSGKAGHSDGNRGCDASALSGGRFCNGKKQFGKWEKRKPFTAMARSRAMNFASGNPVLLYTLWCRAFM